MHDLEGEKLINASLCLNYKRKYQLTFFTGALDDPSKTFIYRSADAEWVAVAEMPPVLGHRYWSGCGLVTRSNGRRDVVVAGGHLKLVPSASPNVGIYSVDDDTWSEGGSKLFNF